jgi:serine/threonine-protein kinase
MRFKNYLLIEQIGKGAQGTVSLYNDKRLGREVAIKSLNKNLINNSMQEGRFVDEAKVLAQLNHPNIVTLYDYISDENGHHLIMEHISGVPLDEMIKNKTGPINELRAINIFLKVLDAISHIHEKGIFHRDIKPSNIMIDESDRVKLLDFGIAKNNLNTENLTRIGSSVGGTPMYMSPEHVSKEKITSGSDIYSLGITLWHMVTGKEPYTNHTEAEIMACILRDPLIEPKAIYPFVSDRMNDIIQKATSKKIVDRFSCCNDFYNALLNLRDELRNKQNNGTQTLCPECKIEVIVKNVSNASIIINRVGHIGNELTEYIEPGTKAKISIIKEGYQIYVKQFTVNENRKINVNLKKTGFFF